MANADDTIQAGSSSAGPADNHSEVNIEQNLDFGADIGDGYEPMFESNYYEDSDVNDVNNDVLRYSFMFPDCLQSLLTHMQFNG